MSYGPPKIAIIGAGPAALTLAYVLHKGGIPYTIFESETAITARKQGGPVNVRYDRGEKVLRALGLFEEYEETLVHPGSELMSLGDKTGKLFLHHSTDTDGNFYSASNAPLVNRREIRRFFLRHLPEDAVQWDRKVQSIIASDDDQTWEVTFVDGSSEKGFDLVVGADGAWSKVRPLVSEAKPHYAGQCFVETEIRHVANAPKSVTDLIKGGSYCFPEPEACLVAQHDGESVWIYAVVQNKPEEWVKDPGFDRTDATAAKKQFLEKEWQGWSDELRGVIVNSDTDITPRAFYMLPVGFKWEHRRGVTLIGDAAHLMTPWGGSGANLALEDGYELGEAIVAQGRLNGWASGAKFVNRGLLDTAVREFEAAMFPRAEKDAERAFRNLQFFRSEGAPQKMLGLIKRLSA